MSGAAKEPEYFYYYKPKVFVITPIYVTIVIALGVLTMTSADTSNRILCAIFFVPLAILGYSLIVDAFIPTIQNKAVMILDERGITDIISWDLIEWSNIESIEPVKVKSAGRGGYSWTEMHIVLKDVNNYEFYRRSWWVRFKVKFIRVFKGVDISMDIDALKGDAQDIFNAVKERFDFYQAHCHR